MIRPGHRIVDVFGIVCLLCWLLVVVYGIAWLVFR